MGGLLPRLVFADMDGTFLADDKQVPAANMRLLDELARAGAAFVPCTGRPVSAIPPQVMSHAATAYVVGSNGAVVYDTRADANLCVVGMDMASVLALYERVRELHTTFDIFADGLVLAERGRFIAMGDYGIDAPTLTVLRNVRKPVDMTVPQIVAQVHTIEKVTCFWKDVEDRDALAVAIDDMGCFSCAHGHPRNFELQAEGVCKGSALQWLCAHTGVPVSEATAFGDEANDVAMLEAAGDGVAMCNATPDVLAVADHVTPLDNNAAGVAQYLLG